MNDDEGAPDDRVVEEEPVTFEDEEEIQPVDPIELAIKNPLFERWWGGWSPSDHYQIANTTDFLCALATDGIDSAINKQIAEEKAFREEQE